MLQKILAHFARQKKRYGVAGLAALLLGISSGLGSKGNDPMSAGHNPGASNPARLSSAQVSALLKDTQSEFNQVTEDQQPGKVVEHIKAAMELAKKDPDLSFIADPALRKQLAQRFTKNSGFLGSGSIRERMLRQNPAEAATASSTLEAVFLLLKYTQVQSLDFAKYYVRGVAAQDITGPAGHIFGTVSDPYHLVKAYLLNGKTVELVSFRDGKPASVSNPALSAPNDNNAADNNSTASTDTSGSNSPGDTNRSNYMNFVYSGAALGLFHIQGHSFLGYWDGTTLRRADTFFLSENGKAFDGLTVKKGNRTLPVQSIQILRLRSPTAGSSSFDPSPGMVNTAYEAITGFLANAGVPHILLILLPALLGLLAFFGKKELRKLEHYLIKIFDHLTGRDDGNTDGSDANEDSLYRRALKLINDNDYTEAMHLLEKHVSEDDTDSPAIVALLETYLFLGEIARYTMLYNAHKKQIDVLAHGMVTRYLTILKNYQNSHYSEMEQNIELMKAALQAQPSETVLWNLDPLANFLNARPAGLQKNQLIAFLAFLRERHQLSTRKK